MFKNAFQDACKTRSDAPKTAKDANMLQITQKIMRIQGNSMFLEGAGRFYRVKMAPRRRPDGQDGARMHAKCMDNTHKTFSWVLFMDIIRGYDTPILLKGIIKYPLALFMDHIHG